MSEKKQEKEHKEKGANVPAQKVEPSRALSPFEQMERDMSRMFEGFFPRGWMQPLRWDWPAWGEMMKPLEINAPRVDIIERDADVVVKAELPGVEKKNIDISVTENTVTIKGSSESREEKKEGDYHRSEIRRGSFARTLALPCTVDSEKVKAAFRDGILEITLPKTVKTKRHSVAID